VDLPDFVKESVPQIQILCTFQARDARKTRLPRNPCAGTRTWRETRVLVPHNAVQKSRILMTI